VLRRGKKGISPRHYGFWWPYLEKVIYWYLDCGDLHNEFALGKCRLQSVILASIPY
jgi:hypothetical protein